MSSAIHPDGDRLSALAGADQDALIDRALVDHVSACDRCTAIVDDLRALRSVLGELPDLVPSRPLQLVPPVPEPAMAPSRGAWLRRLMAPVAAVGLVIAIVGAAGTAGVFDSFQGASMAQAPLGGDRQAEAGGASAGPTTPAVEASNGDRAAADRAPEDQSAAPQEFSGGSGQPLSGASPSSTTPAAGRTPHSPSAAPSATSTAAGRTVHSPSATEAAEPSVGELSSDQGRPPSPWVIVLVAGLALTAGSLAARWMIPTS